MVIKSALTSAPQALKSPLMVGSISVLLVVDVIAQGPMIASAARPFFRSARKNLEKHYQEVSGLAMVLIRYCNMGFFLNYRLALQLSGIQRDLLEGLPLHPSLTLMCQPTGETISKGSDSHSQWLWQYFEYLETGWPNHRRYFQNLIRPTLSFPRRVPEHFVFAHAPER